MKFKNLFSYQFAGFSRFSVSALILFVFSSGIYAQATKLSLIDVVTVLRSKKATADEKNKLLTQGIKDRGTTFSLNEEIEKELRAAGAGEEILQAIREKNPPPKPVVQPKPEPTPAPIQKQPDYTFYQNRGNSSFVMGEYVSAISEYTKAIELNPKESSIYLSRGLAYFNRKGYNAAIADFDKVIELDPKESIAYFNRANALEKVGEFEKALSDFKTAANLDGDNESAKNGIQRLQTLLAQRVVKSQTEQDVSLKQNSQSIEKPEQEKTKEVAPSPVTDPTNIGALNKYAVELIRPQYPAYERQRRTEGLVTVEISLDERGKVLSVKAISGPKPLRSLAEDAARRTKFSPVKVEDKPVKVTGFINYNFKTI